MVAEIEAYFNALDDCFQCAILHLTFLQSMAESAA